jgi:manganese peroxidase
MFNSFSVHLAAAIGTANCAGAPRLKVFIGRPAPAAAAPAGVIPLPTDDVTTILARFAEAGFT